ncbi:MAG: methyltransferase family protein, partial [Halobacteriota archaeon]
RWSNLPIPEAHVAGLLVGWCLQAIRPRRIAVGRWRRPVGLALSGLGIATICWATLEVGDADIEQPGALVTTGPYARSRNPMYVGWSLLYLGLALLTNARWHLLVFPMVWLATHREVRREEHDLEVAFGEPYRAYRRSVRRYL